MPNRIQRHSAGHRLRHRSAEYLVALGHAGWSPGQLESEMAENSWLSVAADEDILFHHDVAERLAAAGQQLGIDVDLLSAEAGHA